MNKLDLMTLKRNLNMQILLLVFEGGISLKATMRHAQLMSSSSVVSVKFFTSTKWFRLFLKSYSKILESEEELFILEKN